MGKTTPTENEKRFKDDQMNAVLNSDIGQESPGARGSKSPGVESNLDEYMRMPNLQYSWQHEKTGLGTIRKNNEDVYQVMAEADQSGVTEMDRVESQLQTMIQKNNELECQIYQLTEENVKLKNVQSSLLQLSQNVNSSI